MAVTIKRAGYGIVEPNHLSAPRDGRVYAQLPAAEDIKVLENGMFVKYDYANGECNFTGSGPWMLVFNEVKLYDERKQTLKDFALLKSEAIDGVITPRVFGLSAGDIFTTNMAVEASYTVGTALKVGEDGILVAGTADDGDLSLEVVAETTCPDGIEPAIKVRVVAD